MKSFVEKRICTWRKSVVINVPLSCGCGPVIDWVNMCEFVPREEYKDLKIQLQYVTGGDGIRKLVRKQSPCLALLEVGLSGELGRPYRSFLVPLRAPPVVVLHVGAMVELECRLIQR